MFEFDANPDRRGTHATKWQKYAGTDILPFWVADMEFRAPPAVIEALHARVEHGVFGYTRVPDTLVEATLAFLAERYGWAVEPNWLVWLPGVVPALNLACRAVGEAGDSVLNFTPVYHPFFDVPGHGGRRRIDVALRAEDGSWRMDPEAVAAAIQAHTRLLMLCNPQNPTGRVYRRDELEPLAELAERHDMVILSDEIHAELVLEPDAHHLPIATLDADLARRTITLMAPTKTYNIPGLPCAFAVVPDAGLRRRLIAAQAGLVPGLSPLAMAAAEAAYRHGEPWRQALLGYLRGNRDHLAQRLATIPGIGMNRVEATCLAWLDVSELDLEDAPAHFESHGVGCSPGAQFGDAGHLRLNFGCSRAMLDEGIDRIERALSALN